MLKPLLTIFIVCFTVFGFSQNLEADGPSFNNEDEAVNITEVAKIPSFKNGTFGSYVLKNFKYPPELVKNDQIFKGIIFIKFIVEQDGSVSEVEILNGRGSGYPSIDNQLIHIIRNCPKWEPGINSAGLPVRVQYMQKVRF